MPTTAQCCLFLALWPIVLVSADDNDPVRRRLDQARTRFSAELQRFQAEATAYFDRRERGARADGNKQSVDQIKSERETFDQTFELPRSAPAAIKRIRQTAETDLRAAYAAAVRDYTRSSADAQAAAAEAELEVFLEQHDPGWIPLFNGRDLTGWVSSEGSQSVWIVHDGELHGSGPHGYLMTERTDFDNFHLRAEVKVSAGGDSGIGFRLPDRTGRRMYEAQIGGGRPKLPATGTIVLFDGRGYPLLATQPDPMPPDVWYDLEVIAVGNQLQTAVDGRVTARYTDRKRTYQRGAISVQQIGPDAAVAIRNLRLKPLPSP